MPTRAARAGWRRPARRSPRRAVPATTLLWIMACLYGLPVLWFILSSLKPASDLFSYPLSLVPDDPTLSGYMTAWRSANFSQYFINTTIVCVITTILTVGVSCCTGYALAKYDNRWLKAFFLCILATTMLPGEVMLAPSFLVVRDLGPGLRVHGETEILGKLPVLEYGESL